jgi:hypothetical protein
MLGALQAFANLDSVFQDLLGRQRTFAQAVGEDLALGELHDQDIGAILMADIVQSVGGRMKKDVRTLGVAVLLI